MLTTGTTMPAHAPLEMSQARRSGLFSISEAARASGVSAKMIRHYESIGLIPGASRTGANYRLYKEADVHMLRFVRRARDLGFSIREIGDLLGLWRNRRRASADVKKLALKQIGALEARIAELEGMRRTLKHLASHCHGDHRPECPIIDELGKDGA